MEKDKLDIIISRLDDMNRTSEIFRTDISERVRTIEKDVKDFKEFKGKVTGICAVSSSIIGLISGWIFRHLGL